LQEEEVEDLELLEDYLELVQVEVVLEDILQELLL
jgi:hypothetical protein